MRTSVRISHAAPFGAFLRHAGLGLMLALPLVACGNPEEKEVKNIKEQVQRATGQKDYRKVLELSQQGMTLALKNMGDKSPDTLYFAQGISESYKNLRNVRSAIPAMRKELEMRAAAGQPEKKLQPRRTLLIQMAEENGDKMTAIEQAVIIARAIEMGPGKDPQPVYQAPTTYPPDLYRQKIEGDVQVAFSMDATGAVIDCRVFKADPPQVFDRAALDSFKSWRFTPMLDKTGQPVPATNLKFTLAFRMGGR